MTNISTPSRCGIGAIALVLSLLPLLGFAGAAEADEHPALAGEPLERLAGHGRYWGLSIIGANGGHPIRRPRELWLAFGTITEYGGKNFEEKIDEYAALFWESNCNEHSYKVEATPTRLNLSGGGSTLVLCPGRTLKEERWLERFFEASPHWRLVNGRLALTARGSRIVLHHRRPHSS
ncbi:MAG TPA: META domain-containing protein [Solirubrobacterales bacterium]|nr:META domain-containing protein [Solirubrobacterales bacterium]